MELWGEQTMKKTTTLLTIILILALLLAGCGSGSKPDDTSDKMYELGVAALEAADEFLDGSLDGDEALKRIAAASTSASYQYEKEKEETGSETLFGTEYSNDYYIWSYIGFLESKLSRKVDGVGTSNDVIETRNTLAEHLNERKR